MGVKYSCTNKLKKRVSPTFLMFFTPIVVITLYAFSIFVIPAGSRYVTHYDSRDESPCYAYYANDFTTSIRGKHSASKNASYCFLQHPVLTHIMTYCIIVYPLILRPYKTRFSPNKNFRPPYDLHFA